ncbi:dihydroxyacetone kinase family protein [Kocuria sp. TGY1127_2]|uniref:dihydroxyacetone kinase family protein n=1 Tax=Kocuria sp. TGY1127_2 TaxID=2711328 RepID=UPI0015BA1C98|nr:dihydroxyacetone kinase family protein [Kocuria sp. TGY1127_2]
MTKLYNDPAEFSDEQLEGFVDLYSDRLAQVPGGVISLPPKTPQVAVIVGGGSGHYPAFAGLVGPGFASGAVVGNIFTSPSAAHVYSVAKAADQGKGVVLTFGNYAGDNMNFGIAAKMLRAEGIDTRVVVVKDDIASDPEFDNRRGIAGDFTVFKAMGAAAAAGKSLDEVERLGNLTNRRTRTLGVAFSGCTMPGAKTPLFEVKTGQMGVGLGIHGEPGIRDDVRPSAAELGRLLVRTVLKDAPENPGGRIGVIVNGLGTTKYEELFLLYRTIAPLLREAGYEIVDPEVGELVTSLDMGGVSLTVLWLDDELEPLWTADAYAAAYRKQSAPLETIEETYEGKVSALDEESLVEASPAALEISERVRKAVASVAELMHDQETYLGEIDSYAGDGDHGRGMVKGSDAALTTVKEAPEKAGPASLIKAAGRSWAMQAGGTSGVLWGASLEAAANTIDDAAESFTDEDLVRAVRTFADSMVTLGGAKVGDKTLLDALLPFADTLESQEGDLSEAWGKATEAAKDSAEKTAELRPQKGRARPLAEKSVGHPDPGAISMSMILELLGKSL